MTAQAVVTAAVGVLTVACAVGVVVSAKAVYSALFLAATMIALAVLYVAQGALFLGIVQVVVYTGAVMMLFLFVLMLIGVDSADSLVETLRGHRITAGLAGVPFGLLLVAAIGHVTVAGVGASSDSDQVEDLAHLIFVRYLWAFELTSALLITAALGAMVLAHREHLTPRMSQRELAIERFRSDAYPGTPPGSGVYALHNSVDTPAMLPDGRFCELSVIRTRERDGLVLTLLAGDDRTAKGRAQQ
ncbi:NADH-quinone oxidoreductase subunit J [Mycolicibacterium sp. BiH015]|uniref:NADH-quinone oxidoreductase subunit J n=1 Tax=Mycolicibacterium sp. BiH015 TaxID=3018808 RepID=UPI0022E31B85|nr:NADH-quinone oxidoreductase subunit J [Mycolicibacterium sp. BiH015]MDA2895194.1 NADH-quinone oxidoreductase subunit J [Mycolicibacterium sp. BiH015]